MFLKSASEDMFQENPCKTLAGRTEIDVCQGLAHKITFAMEWSMLHLEAKKNLENQVRSDQLTSGYVFG